MLCVADGACHWLIIVCGAAKSHSPLQNFVRHSRMIHIYDARYQAVQFRQIFLMTGSGRQRVFIA